MDLSIPPIESIINSPHISLNIKNTEKKEKLMDQ
jgi:hypothetical protein